MGGTDYALTSVSKINGADNAHQFRKSLLNSR